MRPCIALPGHRVYNETIRVPDFPGTKVLLAREVTMDALLGMRGWHWRRPDWTAGAVAGLAAGALLMVLDLLWSGLFNAGGPWRISHMIAPLLMGTDAPNASGYAFQAGVVSISLAMHYGLGIVFGLVLAAVMSQLRLDANATWALATGAIAGIVLYLLNFDILAQFLPWLATLRGGDTLAAQVVFGIVTALLYWRLKRTPSEG
jgi:hypothetical protein